MSIPAAGNLNILYLLDIRAVGASIPLKSLPQLLTPPYSQTFQRILPEAIREAQCRRLVFLDSTCPHGSLLPVPWSFAMVSASLVLDTLKRINVEDFRIQ